MSFTLFRHIETVLKWNPRYAAPMLREILHSAKELDHVEFAILCPGYEFQPNNTYLYSRQRRLVFPVERMVVKTTIIVSHLHADEHDKYIAYLNGGTDAVD